MRFAPNERRTASPASTRRFLSKSFSRRRGLSRDTSALRPGLSPAPLRAGGQVKSLLMLASKPHRGVDCRAREAFAESFGAERRPAFARFAAGFSPTSSGVPMRRPGSSPVFSRRVPLQHHCAWRVSSHLPSTHYCMARLPWRGAERAIGPGGLESADECARAIQAYGRVMPARVPNGQQDDHRRLPSRRNKGGGAARQ